MKLIITLYLFFLLSACSTRAPIREQQRARLSESQDLLSPKMTKELITGQTKPPKPEEVKTELKSQLNKWWFGHGVGRTTTNLATIVVFPPWGLYLLTNAGVALAGYEPVYITDALGKETKKEVLNFYDGATSIPGRVNAAIAGRKFYNSPSTRDEEEKNNEENWNNSKINSLPSQRTR